MLCVNIYFFVIKKESPVIMTMTMIVTKTMIMTMVATTTMTKIFKQVQQDNFYCLLKMIKKDTKIQFALLL